MGLSSRRLITACSVPSWIRRIQTELDYVVYLDFDVVPMSEAFLFDSVTINHLNEQGIVLAAGGILGYENLFHIIKHRDPSAREAIQTVTIDYALRILYSNGIQYSAARIEADFIFGNYENMLGYNYNLSKYGRSSA